MLFVKRFFTAAILFVFLFVFLYIGVLMVGCGAAGAMASSKADMPQAASFQEGYNRGYEIGRVVGAKFAKKYRGIIALGSFGTSAIVSLVLSFGGVLPWCRRQTPPPLTY